MLSLMSCGWQVAHSPVMLDVRYLVALLRLLLARGTVGRIIERQIDASLLIEVMDRPKRYRLPVVYCGYPVVGAHVVSRVSGSWTGL